MSFFLVDLDDRCIYERDTEEKILRELERLGLSATSNLGTITIIEGEQREIKFVPKLVPEINKE